MKQARRQYSADWKAKIALEAIKGQRTIQQIASHYEIHSNLVTHWKKQLLEGAAEIFSNGQAAAKADEESVFSRLHG
jgi:transposase-like protein